MKDCVGNRIEVGALLMWLDNRMKVKVLEVSDGGIEDPVTHQFSPAHIKVELDFGFPVTKGDKREVQIGNFIVYQDPEAGKRAEETLKSVLDPTLRPFVAPKPPPSEDPEIAEG